MKKKICLFIFLIIIQMVACKKEKTKEERTDKNYPVLSSEKDTIFKLDTILKLSNLKASNYKGLKLNNDLSKVILHNYFKKKGYLIKDDSSYILEDEDYKKIEVRHKITHLLSLNNNSYPDAIVEYWLAPPLASGHCWQPHKSTIIDTDIGYELSNEEFIPTNYKIDSVITKSNKSLVYSYEYDCLNHKIMRYLQITLR